MEYPQPFKIQPYNVYPLHVIYTHSYNNTVSFKHLLSIVYIMPPKGTNLVSNIKPWKTEWRIHVKAVHSWRQQTKFGGESLEMILADETVSIQSFTNYYVFEVFIKISNSFMFYIQGAKIHASCKESFVPKVQRELPINEWRVIDTFSVSPARGHYRTTTHAYRIAITSDTSITPSDVKIDNPFLSLTSFKSITNGHLEPDFLIGTYSLCYIFVVTIHENNN